MAAKPYIVLCVDDEPVFLETVAEELKGIGYAVVTAESAQAAMPLIEQHRSQLICIISDYSMPGTNGFELRQMVAQKAKEVPFIILSAFVTKDMALKGLDIGVAAFLNKPTNSGELQEVLKEKTKAYVEVLEEKIALEALFIRESQDLIEEIEPLLLAIEGDPDNSAHLNSVFRLVHTVKGASGVLDRPEITAFLHSFEDLLTRIKNGLKATPTVVTALLQAFDVLKTTIGQLSQGQKSSFDFTQILGVLKNAATKAAGPAPEAQPQGAAAPAAAGEAKAGGILVPTPMLDEFMQLAGEITVIRNMVNKQVRAIERRTPGDSDVNQLSVLLDEMHKINATMQNRIVELKKIQVSTVFSKLPRTVRDLSRQLGKQVALELTGSEVRVDTTIAAALNNSLIHMVRNCVDHGIERTEVRTAAGKAPGGTIRLNCREEKDHIVVTISDDGNGIDPERIRRKLIDGGRMPSEKIAALTRQELFLQIFEPGFSTAAEVTDVSGRGVGMDMVRDSITKLKGRIDISSELGKGTNFVLTLPVPRSVVIVSSLVVETSGRHFAVPQDNVNRLIRLGPQQQRAGLSVLPGGTCMLRYEQTLLPLLDLAQLLGLQDGKSLEQAATGQLNPEEINILVLKAEQGMFGLVVGAVHDTEDAVLKTLHRCVEVVGVYRGATFMGDGRVGLILDVDGLVKVGQIGEHFTQAEQEGRAKELELSEANAKAKAPADQYLTFTLESPGSFAVPLTSVFRFEEFALNAVKNYGDHRALIYRDVVMPLIDLAAVLHPTRPTTIFDDGREDTSIRVFITEQEQRFFAFAVKDICEITTPLGTLDPHFRRAQGTLGLILIDGNPTTIVDIPALLTGQLAPPPPVQAAVGWELF